MISFNILVVMKRLSKDGLLVVRKSARRTGKEGSNVGWTFTHDLVDLVEVRRTDAEKRR
jgi:hypothetical protein